MLTLSLKFSVDLAPYVIVALLAWLARAKVAVCYNVFMTRSHNTRHFPVIVEEDADGFFVATNPALPGCYSQGKSMEEALANVREATEASLAERSETDVSTPNISVHVIAL